MSKCPDAARDRRSGQEGDDEPHPRIDTRQRSLLPEQSHIPDSRHGADDTNHAEIRTRHSTHGPRSHSPELSSCRSSIRARRTRAKEPIDHMAVINASKANRSETSWPLMSTDPGFARSHSFALR